MAKKKLEIRKPLTEREAIAPQALRPVAHIEPEPEKVEPPKPAPAEAPKAQPPTNQNGELKRYTTYLAPQSIKKIKLHAVETDVPDYSVVQAAIDAYFEKKKRVL